MTEDTPRHRVVVFIDMLGFSRLVEQFDGHNPIAGFRDFNFASLAELDEQLSHSHHPLEQRFGAFHGVIEAHVRRMMRNDAPHAVTFSDSAFVAFQYPIYAYRFAVNAMRDLVLRQTPVRMGIAAGTFRARRFASDVTEHVQRHSFQFFGTGVVASHAAEDCGIKGMRILLHPNLPVTDDLVFSHITNPLDSTRPSRPAVVRELNYTVRDYPVLMHIPDDQDECHFDADLLTVAIQLMARQASSDPDVQVHYQRTQEAILRMRGLAGP